MPSTLKVSLLALASTVAAVPHYGGHGRFHSQRPSGAHGTGKAYPTGGWAGRWNQTRVAQPTGTGVYDSDTTVDVTSTTTTTLLTTVVVRPSPVGGEQVSVGKENVPTGGSDQCGPLTVTVTAQEVVTVTVAPGSGSSAAPSPVVPDGGYGVPSSAAPVPVPEPAPSAPPAPVEPSPTPKPVEPLPSAQPSPAPPAVPSEPAAPQVPASSAAPPAAPTPSGSGNHYSGTKRGLAYNSAHLCKDFAGNFGFAYNWGQTESNDINTAFVPTLHGHQMPTSQEWLSNVDKAVQRGSKAVMGFNEPDHKDQANMTPEAACANWKQYMNPVAAKYPQLTILGPSVTNGPASQSMGLDGWLAPFYQACPDAVVHATNMHFYDIYEPETINRFKAQVDKAASFGKPVWVTEFGLNPGSASQEQAASFLKDAMAYLDSNDKVQGYAWFMVGTGENQLNAGDGLSAVGKVYAGQA